MTEKKVTPFLMFNDSAEEALEYYSKIFPDTTVTNKNYYSSDVPMLGDKLMSAIFKVGGQEFLVSNGGSHFSFTPGFSIFVKCETQVEIDQYWNALKKEGQEQPCGWVLDKFGISWQIIPSKLHTYLTDRDKIKSKRVMDAMLQMTKMNIDRLKNAYDG